MKRQLFAAGLLVAACSAKIFAAGLEHVNSDAAFSAGLRDIRSAVQAQGLKLKQPPKAGMSPAGRPVDETSPGEVYFIYAGAEAAPTDSVRRTFNAADLPNLGEDADKAGMLKRVPEFTVVRKGEAYFIYGKGSATEGGGIKGLVLQLGYKEKVGENVSVGVVYLNEGHADNDHHYNHRDGFAVMGWWEQPVGDKATVQVGAGPYFSMNTTMIDGQQRDDKNTGLLMAAALAYRLNRSGLGLRAQYNHVKMGTFDSNAVMVGVSQELGGERTGGGSSAGAFQGTTVSLGVGPAITNRSGQKGHLGYQAEVERAVDKAFHYSVSVIAEGDSTLTDRAGAAIQAWYVAPAGDKWMFSAGAGPYIAQENDLENRGIKLLGIVSFRAERDMGDGLTLGFKLNRIVSAYDKDEDMLMGYWKKPFRFK